ncbi:MAG: pilus assembly protein PilP [Pseudomonadota bacterium]
MRARRNTRALGAPVVVCAALVLGGCGEGDIKEVKQWMAEVDKTTKVAIRPLPEPKAFVPYAFAVRESVDPFNPNKLLVELAKLADQSNNPLKPDPNRRKELLEAFPLDTMKMVGIIQKDKVNTALLQIDKQVYPIVNGQRVGQNYGVVTNVGEDAISIKEVVQDAGGDWVERMSKLELQVSKETK